MNLSELWIEASKYGRVHMFTAGDLTVSCTIKFNTINHAELEAKSGYSHVTPEIAVENAIKVAKQIVNGTRGQVMKFDEQKSLTDKVRSLLK